MAKVYGDGSTWNGSLIPGTWLRSFDIPVIFGYVNDINEVVKENYPNYFDPEKGKYGAFYRNYDDGTVDAVQANSLEEVFRDVAMDEDDGFCINAKILLLATAKLEDIDCV